MPSNAKRRKRRAEARENRHTPSSNVVRLISVYSAAGRLLQRDCDGPALLRYKLAKNADVVMTRNGELKRIDMIPIADETELKSIAGGRAATYEEQLGGEEFHHPLVTLKKFNPRSQTLTKWKAKERFTPGRFNPDMVSPVKQHRALQPPIAA